MQSNSSIAQHYTDRIHCMPFILIGGCPKVIGIYTPGLTKTNVPTEKTVEFTCDARGAAPLKYQWKCDGTVLNLHHATVKIKVKKSGNYSCCVENEFGSVTSEQILLTVGKSKITLWEL